MRIAIVLALVIASVAALPAQKGELKPRIVDGEDAERRQFPYIVSAQIYGGHNCGGCIISPTVVVTAAHCFATYDRITVIAGILDLEESHPDNQAVSVSQVIPHPDWNGMYNDILVLKLATPLIFNEAVQPIGLPEAGSIATGLATVSGWGRTSVTPSIYPTHMQFLEMPIISVAECNQRFEENQGYLTPVIDTELCTLPNRAAQSACHGDSGGPLVQDGVLVGVVHGGNPSCGTLLPEESPNVFTRVSSFVDFIKQHTPDL